MVCQNDGEGGDRGDRPLPRVTVPRDLPQENVAEPPAASTIRGVPLLKAPKLRESDVSTVEERIKESDANFRQKFAERLFTLFFTAVLVGPTLILVAIGVEMFAPQAVDFDGLTERASILATSIIGTVAGVFGTVMGFYYGSEKK